MLKEKPPITTIKAKKYPSPGNNLLARSCALNSLTVSILQVFTCAPISSMKETNITNPKLAINCCVKTVVCVRKPGPILELAIKKAAPKPTPLKNGTLFFLEFNIGRLKLMKNISGKLYRM